MFDDLPVAAGSFSLLIDNHIRLIYWICGVWFVLAQGVLFYALVRFRKKPGVRAAWLPGVRRPELGWLLWPVALVFVCDMVIEWDSARVWAAVKEHRPQTTMEIGVMASQFAYEFRYAGPDGRLDTADDIRSPELHVPLHEAVSLRLESRDVLHSLFIPQFRLKQDIVPGRQIRAWIKPTHEGRYVVACAELCGVGHSFMQSAMVVESRDNFARWTAEHVSTAGGAR